MCYSATHIGSSETTTVDKEIVDFSESWITLGLLYYTAARIDK